MSVTATTPSLTTRPEYTADTVGTIITWLQQGSYVVIHDLRSGRFLHACLGRSQTEQQIETFMQTHQIIYVNTSPGRGSLDPESWMHRINQAGFYGCTCNLKGRVLNTKSIPHGFAFTI